MTFGKAVLELRTKNGISRDQLIKTLQDFDINMHPTTLRRIEAETQQPKLDEAQAIAQALGTTINDMLDGGTYTWLKNGDLARITNVLETQVLAPYQQIAHEVTQAVERLSKLDADLVTLTRFTTRLHAAAAKLAALSDIEKQKG